MEIHMHMKKLNVVGMVVTVGLATLLGGTAFALSSQDGAARERVAREGASEHRHGPRQGMRGALRERMLERFDADGDGVLSEEEREKAFATAWARLETNRPERAAKLLERFDADGDGALDADERRAARDEIRGNVKARLVERLDVDGDGTLTGDERQTARAAVRARIAPMLRGLARGGAAGSQ